MPRTLSLLPSERRLPRRSFHWALGTGHWALFFNARATLGDHAGLEKCPVPSDQCPVTNACCRRARRPDAHRLFGSSPLDLAYAAMSARAIGPQTSPPCPCVRSTSV